MANGGKTPAKGPMARCRWCRKPVRVMPSGLYALHTVTGKWKKSMCRGSGEPVHVRKRPKTKP